MTFSYLNCYFGIGANANSLVALTATKITVEDGYESSTVKRFGDATAKTLVGMQKQSVVATFLQDFSSNSVHAELRAAVAAGANGIYVVVRPDAGVVTNSNPQWAGQMVLADYKPLDGAAGDPKGDVVATFTTNGTALAYTTA